VSYPGNHDLRLRVYFTRYCPALDDYHPFDLDVLLDFGGHGVTLLPDFYPFTPGWIATHGHLGFSLSHRRDDRAECGQEIGKNLVCGHAHRQGVVSESTGYDGRLTSVTGVEAGHLMDVRKADYLKAGWANWAAGFAVLELSGRLLPLNHGGSGFVLPAARSRSRPGGRACFSCLCLVQELRGDYVETVLYLGDEHDILRPHVPRLVPAKAVTHPHHFQRPHRR
jgi:hypothetical protein